MSVCIKKTILLLLAFFFLIEVPAYSQTGAEEFFTHSPDFNKGRFATVMISQAVVYTATMLILRKVWYKKYSTGKFHLFNDNREWLMMDKAGHFTTAYNMGRVSYGSLMWSGVNQRDAAWMGAGFAMLFLGTVEVFDGYSDGWGFSWGDMAANTLGAGMLVGQDYLWQQQRITAQFSYKKSIYADMNPDLLGTTRGERMLKDYNAQTYWLSFNVASFVPVGPDFPRWLDASIGYGADGMIRAHKAEQLAMTDANVPKRFKQFYLAPGLNWNMIQWNSPYPATLMPLLNVYKVPFPSLEYNSLGKVKGHLIGW